MLSSFLESLGYVLSHKLLWKTKLALVGNFSKFKTLKCFSNLSSSLSSSCHAINTDIPDPLSPPFYIVSRFRQVLKFISRICTELLYVGSSWSSRLCSSMRGVHKSTTPLSSSQLLPQYPACVVRLTWIVFARGRKAAVLLGVASRTYSILLAVYLCSWQQAFSPYVL